MKPNVCMYIKFCDSTCIPQLFVIDLRVSQGYGLVLYSQCIVFCKRSLSEGSWKLTPGWYITNCKSKISANFTSPSPLKKTTNKTQKKETNNNNLAVWWTNLVTTTYIRITNAYYLNRTATAV